MLSLKSRTKEELLQALKDRTSQIAKMTTESDMIRSLERALRKLNQKVYLHRAIIIKAEDIHEYDGGFFVDITNYGIDEVVNVIFAPTPFVESSWIDPELGILPYISNSSSFTTQTLINYLQQLTNLNMMVRQACTAFDYYVWPVSASGHQFMQLRNKTALTEIRFLPLIDPKADKWVLYEDEYQFIIELSYLYLLQTNAEQMFSANPLGGFKESASLLEKYDQKVKDLIEEFQNGSLIGGIN